jgi:hypothetical protein
MIHNTYGECKGIYDYINNNYNSINWNGYNFMDWDDLYEIIGQINDLYEIIGQINGGFDYMSTRFSTARSG